MLFWHKCLGMNQSIGIFAKILSPFLQNICSILFPSAGNRSEQISSIIQEVLRPSCCPGCDWLRLSPGQDRTPHACHIFTQHTGTPMYYPHFHLSRVASSIPHTRTPRDLSIVTSTVKQYHNGEKGLQILCNGYLYPWSGLYVQP